LRITNANGNSYGYGAISYGDGDVNDSSDNSNANGNSYGNGADSYGDGDVNDSSDNSNANGNGDRGAHAAAYADA
jgi:hypothetical protein